MRNTIFSIASVCTALLAALLLAAAPAQAGGLDDAKAKGYVGERPDGKVGLVTPNAPASVKALVEQINEGRMASYADIARKNKIPAEAVAARAGAKLVDRAPSGHYVLQNGEWVRKP